MEKRAKMESDLPEELVHKAPIWAKFAISFGYSAPYISALTTGWPGFREDMDPWRYPFRWPFLLLFVFGGAYWILRTVFTKTTFGECELVHRNSFLQTTRKHYRDISDFSVWGSNLKLEFKDGGELNLDLGESRMPQTVLFLKRRIENLGTSPAG